MLIQRNFTVDEVLPSPGPDRPHKVKVKLFADGTPDVMVQIEAAAATLPDRLRRTGARVTITIE
jgi:hypothetical protein